MNDAIFDEAKGVYRVNNPDGSFNTYTPAQYRELSNGAVPVVEEEEGDTNIVAPREVVVTQEVLNEFPELVEEGLRVGDVGTVIGDTVDFSIKADEVAGTAVVAEDIVLDTTLEAEITTDETNTQA